MMCICKKQTGYKPHTIIDGFSPHADRQYDEWEKIPFTKRIKNQIEIVDGQITQFFPLFEFCTCQRRTAKARVKN
jgi:hypothetical protein